MKKLLTTLILVSGLLLPLNAFSQKENYQKQFPTEKNTSVIRACQNVQMSPVRKPKEVCATYFFWKDPLTGKEMSRIEIDERDEGYLPFQRYLK